MADDKLLVEQVRHLPAPTPITTLASGGAARQAARTDAAARPDAFGEAMSQTTPARARTAATLQRSLGNRRAGNLIALPSPVIDETAVGRPAQDHPQPAPASAAQRSDVTDVLRTPGRSLESKVRAEMETALGGDLSAVRLHTGPAAQRSAEEIGARAYTSGSHVVIGDGGENNHILAHELIHVIQQRQGPVAATDNGTGLRTSDPSDRFEREADANAHRIMVGGDRSPTYQRAMDTRDGEATPARGGERVAVQRYVDVEPGAHNYPSKHRGRLLGSNKSAENDERFFPSQSETGDSYFASADPPTANVTYNGSVRLRFSDSFDLAIEHGTGESKVFFATEAHIEAANKALAGRVRFHKGTRYLSAQGRDEPLYLYQVEPVVETKRTGVAGMLGMTKKATGLSILTPQRCNEMAEFVTGKYGLSLQGISAWENFLAEVLDIVEGDRKHRDGLRDVFNEAVKDSTKNAQYEKYSQNMSSQFQDLKEAGSTELEDALRRLGLNQFLPPPPPGSALATVGFGNAEQEKDRKDARDRGEDATFSYHFGATVATSGNDYVTMENYARRDPHVGNATASSGDPLFFFKMYGTMDPSRPDQETWHSVQTSSGNFIGAILSITIEG